MFRRIANFFKLDAALSIRDSIMVYSLISPLVLALVVRLVVPTVQGTTFTMVVDESVPQRVATELARYGDVERVASLAALEERVEENDDVPGLYRVDERFVLVLEGNEDEGALEGFRTIVADAIDLADTTTIAITDLEGEAPPILEYAAVMLVVLALFVGGILVGFNIVYEKESAVIRAMAVSPLRMVEYVAARSILAVILAYGAGFGSAYIVLGAAVPPASLALAIAAALFVALPFGFIIGAFADNQMTAFALIKLLMAFFITVPFVSIFVADRFQFFFFVFPNYWMFTSVSNALVGSGVVGQGLAMLLSVVTGLIMVVLLFPRLRKGLRLR